MTKIPSLKEQAPLKIVESIHRMASFSKDRHSQNLMFQYLEGLQRILKSEYFSSNQEKIIDNIERASFPNQFKSKFWLIDILKSKNLLNLGNVLLCGGWYGFLPFFMLNDKDFTIKQFFNFEKDPLSVNVSEDLNRLFVKNGWKFKASLKDILELDYNPAQFETLKHNGTNETLKILPNTIINTSSEHIQDFQKWWDKLPSNTLIILQSNNFFDEEEHINCVSSLKEFKKQAPLSLIYEGELDLEQYTRYMLIGHK